ncbi:MAG: phosphoserine phosphatase SerB [Candidatus Marinimicrobia bacterium]|nr:phosphoserine phosphatase SerB [Candidatus Neomarinimicrobiota bacterium]
MSKREVLLLTITGQDKPGLTTSITEILSEYKADILDIGQAVIHNSLSLGMLVEIEDIHTSNILKDLLYKSYDLDISVKFNPVHSQDYRDWVKQQGKGRYIVSMLSRRITAKQIAAVTNIIYKQGLNIDIINRLTGRVPLDPEKNNSKACVEFSVRGIPADEEKMKSEFYNLTQDIEADIAFQHDDIYRKNRRLVCFDMDSTLIQAECIVELAKRHGVGKEVHEVTEAAMRGELDFKESFTKRVALLKGLDVSVMQEIADELVITEGAERLIGSLKAFGYKIAVLSGGFTFFARELQKKLGIDYIYANDLEVADGKLTGNYLGDVVDGERKAQLMKLIAQMEHIQLEQVIAVGDGANDLPMINAAGLGIAFHAKPLVQQNARHAISTVGLDGILYLLGYRDRHLAQRERK